MQVAARLAEAEVEATLPVAPVASPERFYRPELDALRFFAFLAVFTCHVLPHAPPWAEIGMRSRVLDAVVRSGNLGVPFFFVLSAFLITELLLREHDRTGTVNVRSFYARRVLRIWPLYYAFLAFALVMYVAFGSRPWDWRHFAAMALLVGNWTTIVSPMTVHFTSVLWSVCVEEQFYLAWPLAIRRVTPQRILGLAVGLVVAGTVARLGMMAAGLTVHAAWLTTFTHLDSIGIGGALAVLLRREKRSTAKAALGTHLGVLGLNVAGVVAAMYFLRISPPRAAFVLGLSLVPLGFAFALRACLRPDQKPSRVLCHPALVYLGKISYGLYVLHMFAVHLSIGVTYGTLKLSGASSLLVHVTLSMGLTVGLAALSYRFVESPFLKLKERFARVKSRPV